MSSIQEISDQIASKSYEKLARLYHLSVKRRGDESKLKKILELEGDINYQVPNSSCIALKKPNFVGNTALHFLAQQCDSKAAELFIKHGADPTIKNLKGLTAIHQIIRSVYKNNFRYRDPFMIHGILEEPFIDLLLAAHVQRQNSKNPRDPYGFSHFHAACMANDTKAVEFFLNNEVPINEAIDTASPMFPGYTPLHFATRLGCVEVANILLCRGANILLKDTKDMTALHLAIEQSMTIVQYMNLHRQDDDEYQERPITKKKLLTKIANNESIINSILSKIDQTIIDSLGLSAFYVMHTVKNTLLVNNYTQDNINEPIDVNSPFWPGYTPLHFAARLNVDTLKLLLERGANIEAKDANGYTPFDMCVGIYDVKEIHYILSRTNTWREIRLSDGKTKLVDLIRAMCNTTDFVSFLNSIERDINNISIPINSPLWPGSTILHLAVIMSKKCIGIQVKNDCSIFHEYYTDMRPNELLEVSVRLDADNNTQDLYGSTPLHLAFRRLDVDNIYLLLENRKGNTNPVDRDNVSHLHIACAMENENAVKELIDCGVDVNGTVSSTFQWEMEVQRDLDISFEGHFMICGGSTPLHIAITVGNKKIVKLLTEAGADLDAKNIDGLTPIHLLFMNSSLKKSIGEILLSPLISKDYVVNGLSYLHIASYGECPKAEKAVEKLLQLGANINSTILAGKSASSSNGNVKESDFHDEISRNTSKLAFLLNYFEGNTPLHLAVNNWRVNIPTCLITHGADVHAKNSVGGSPICSILTKDYLLKHFVSVMNDDDEKRLIREMGVTKLHMACKLCDEKTIQHCVKNGANVNAQIHNDSRIWPGYTPLHILVESYDEDGDKRTSRIIRFLLKNGADVTIADSKGDTPLLLNIYDNHVDERPPHIDILMKCLKNTVVNPVNSQGISHFHLACIRNNVALIERFLKLDADVNQTVDYFSDVYPGYTPLHFAACRRCEWLRNDIPPLRTVHLLLKYGANVHATDVLDNNPLHIAAQYLSLFKLPYKRILWAGADPESKDFYDMAPPSYLIELIDDETWNNLSYMCCDVCGYPIRKLRSAIRNCLNKRTNRDTIVHISPSL